MSKRRHLLGSYHKSFGLSESWQTWVAESLLDGHTTDELQQELIAAGVPARLAAEELVAMSHPALLAAGRATTRRADRLQLVLDLKRQLTTLSQHPHGIEQRPTIEADEFYERYLCTNTPLVLTELTRAWPALRCWGKNDLLKRFGDEELEFCSGRASDPTPDKNFEQHRETGTVADFVERIDLRHDSGNDTYLIAHNHALDNSALRALLDDIIVPDFMDPMHGRGSASLWIGPAGTRTPMHHDTCNILFSQIVGRKRFRLLDPLCSEVLENLDGFYAQLDEESYASLAVKEVVLEPGMTLFLPAGWWHDVVALEFSMSISLLRFQRRIDLSWYTPGQVE